MGYSLSQPHRNLPKPIRPRTNASILSWNWQRVNDYLFQLVCRTAAISILVLLGLLFLFLALQSWPAIQEYGARFLCPVESDPNAEGTPKLRSLAFIYGTLATSALAML